MAKTNIAILGGKGMLGSDLANRCAERNLSFEVFDLPEFDITNSENVHKVIENSELVINCAAYTNVEKAETEQNLAHKINAEAVGRLGILAKKTGTWVMHISTDFVFDGKSDSPYIETDLPGPINAYGRSKLAGEKLLIESGCPHCIMRTQWTYGFGGNNFVKKLVSRAKQGDPLKVVDDQIGSPTATTEIAGAICELLPKRPQGIFHFANAGYVSRFDMARFIIEKLGISVDLNNCKSAGYATAAKRPLNSCFDCGKIQALLSEPIKPWQLPLEEFLKKL